MVASYDLNLKNEDVPYMPHLFVSFIPEHKDVFVLEDVKSRLKSPVSPQAF